MGASCPELSRDTERFSPVGHFPEEGSPVSPPGLRKLVSPWDLHASSSALCGNCQEEVMVLDHRNPLLSTLQLQPMWFLLAQSVSAL